MLAPHRLVQAFSPIVIVGSASFIAGIAASYVFVVLQHQPPSDYVSVQTSTLVHTVHASGVLKATESIDLGFQSAGVVDRMNVRVGSRVTNKQFIASISPGSLSAELISAKADLATETARLQQLQSGTSTTDLAGARAAVVDQIAASFAVANTAVNMEVEQFIHLRTMPRLSFQTSNFELERSVLLERTQADQLLLAWKAALSASDSATSTNALTAAATLAADHLSSIESFLNHVGSLLAYAVPSSLSTAAEIQSFRDAIAKARLTIASSLTELTAVTGKLSLAEVTVGPQATEIQKSVVASAAAKVRTLEERLNATRLIAPIAGTIVEKYVSVGSSVAAGQPVFSLSSEAHAEITISVSAADAGTIHPGDSAVVDLDGYPNKHFVAQVVAITPHGETGKQETSVTVQLVDDDSSLTYGTAGTVVITTTPKKDALLVPRSALIIKDGQSFVLRASSTSNRDDLVPVVTGITADSGEIEIISGLSAGDKIRTSISVY